MMDIALLAANASQLKAVLQQSPQYGPRPPWNAACLAFLGLSMALQMVLGELYPATQCDPVRWRFLED